MTQQFATWVRKVVGRPPAYSYAALMITPLPSSVSSVVPSAPLAARGEVGFTEHRNSKNTGWSAEGTQPHLYLASNFWGLSLLLWDPPPYLPPRQRAGRHGDEAPDTGH